MNKGGGYISEELLIKLTHQPLFSELDINFLREYVIKVTELHLLKGEIIFRRGERYHKGIYFITSGKVELENSKTKTKGVRQNDVIGITTYLSKTMYENTATTLTDADIIFIPEIYIYHLISASVTFRKKVIQTINLKLRDIGTPKNNFLYHKAYKYLLNFIKTPIVTINASATPLEASKKMKEYFIDCLLVSNRKHTLKGLLSRNNLLTNYFECTDKNKDMMPVENFADVSPLLLPDELPIDIALNEMNLANKRCAVVISDSKPIGIVSEKDLQNDITETSDTHSAYIANLKSIDDAKTSLANIHIYCEDLMTSSRISRHELIKLSSIHIAIQERVYQFTTDYFYEKYNFRLSDYTYNFVLLGAAARLELDLRPRIINAIILDDDIDDETYQRFIEFSNVFQTNLGELGYSHPQCNKPILNNYLIKREKDWYKSIDDWASNPKSDIRTSFFCLMDMKSFDGDYMLSHKLDNYIRAKIKDKPSLLIQMLNASPQIRIPISNFGAFILEQDGYYKGKINLQDSAIHYIALLTRLLNLYIDSTELSTVNRIKLLARFKIISPDMLNKITYAFDTLIATLLNEQIALAYNNEEISVGIAPSKLSLVYQEKLLRALQFLSEYSNQMRTFLTTL